jgi:hypothetical protein
VGGLRGERHLQHARHMQRLFSGLVFDLAAAKTGAA